VVLWREGNHMIAKLATVTGLFSNRRLGRALHNSPEERSNYGDSCIYAAVLVVFISKA
jgi:hypothetical protein